MNKIRKIKFIDHPILGNLELDFCNNDGNAVDTVIIAGENGVGKSTILNCLYDISTGKCDFQSSVEIETDKHVVRKLDYYSKTVSGTEYIWATDHNGMDAIPSHNDFNSKYQFAGVFSDVDINFRAQDISYVTSMALDATNGSRRSSTELPKQINQLLIDIQALDDSELAHAYRMAKESLQSTDKIGYTERIPRFTSAFNRMFETLTYSRVINQKNKKTILFQKYGVDVPIADLSSGEKQIIYRGCFLLKDINATNGAFVFIDEPEISLHPNWQMKIMDYYKGIFTSEDGKQTSQIFAVTHSPFVIHNENRRNDKVIVLSRNEAGDIIVSDKPEYYKCNSVEVVQDAFNICELAIDKPTVYLEGRTDEMYFNKALEVYRISAPFQFKWVGYIDAKGEEANTGKDALNKAVSFLISRQLPVRSVCLYDCDTSKPKKEVRNVLTMSLPKYDNDKGISIGIENALTFGSIDVEPYKQQRIEVDGYGIEKRLPDFQKMACCKHVCSLDSEILKSVFVNLKTVIEDLVKLFSGD